MKIEIKDGAVFNDGKQIGHIDGERLICDKHPGPKVLGEINKAHGSKLKLDILPENQPKKNLGPNGAQGDPVTGLGLPHETRAGTQAAEVAHASPPANPADPEPAQDPMKGDKDPAWLAWKARQRK